MRSRWHAVVVTFVSTALLAPAAEAAEPTVVTGAAYGARARLTNEITNTTARLGAVARQAMPCEPDFGQVYSNHVDRSNLATHVNLGVIVNEGVADETGDGGLTVRETSTVANAGLLAGEIKATGVEAVSRTTTGGPGGTAVSGNTTIASLQIGGQTIDIPENPNPNTKIPLSQNGRSFVTLNHQREIRAADGSLQGLRVTAILVRLNGFAGLEGRVYIAHARTSLNDSVDTIYRAYAFGLTGQVGDLVNIGRQAQVNLPCAPGGRERAAARVTLSPPLGNIGAMETSVFGGPDQATGDEYTTASAETASTNLLQTADHPNGIVQAQLVRAGSMAVQTATGGMSAVGGTTIASLSIMGNPVTVDPMGRNQTFEIPGIGQVIINRQICNGSTLNDGETCTGVPTGSLGAERIDLVTTAIVIEVLTSNPDFPLGTRFRIAEAFAGLRG